MPKPMGSHTIGAAETLCTPGADGTCSICADEALPGIVLSVSDGDATAVVEMAIGVETVALDLVDDVSVGDCVMVHLGFAISRIAAESS